MILKTTTELKNLRDEPLTFEGKPFTLGQALSEILLGRSTSPHKSYILAMKLYQNPEVELDSADLQFIKDAVTTSTMNAIVTGQIIEILNTSS